MRASVEPQKPVMYLNCQHIPLICFIFSLHRFLFHSFIFFLPCLSLSISLSFSSQWLRSNYNFLPLHTELYSGIAFARWDMQNRTRQHRKRHTNVYFPHERFFAMGFSLLACLKMSLTLVARFAVVSFFLLLLLGKVTLVNVSTYERIRTNKPFLICCLPNRHST